MKTLEQLICKKCGKKWFPRIPHKPIKCPQCQAKDWDSSDGKKTVDNI